VGRPAAPTVALKRIQRLARWPQSPAECGDKVTTRQVAALVRGAQSNFAEQIAFSVRACGLHYATFMNVRASLLIAFGSVALSASTAHAEENLVRSPNLHPHHSFELEPHVLLAPFYDKGLPGVGIRGTFTLSDDGFIRSINDSVGLGIGADWTHDTTWVPLVLQWNFWLSEHWSVFGEPGIALRLRDDFNDRGPDFTIYGGGRYRFGRTVALTARIGHPAVSLGLSFLL